jgi:hypothetical protein
MSAVAFNEENRCEEIRKMIIKEHLSEGRLVGLAEREKSWYTGFTQNY